MSAADAIGRLMNELVARANHLDRYGDNPERGPTEDEEQCARVLREVAFCIGQVLDGDQS